MTNVYSWTTPRGAKVEATITVEHVTKETAYADGWNVEVACDHWTRTVNSITLNDKPTALKKLCTEHNIRCILIAMSGKDRILVALPDNVVEAIYGEEGRDHAKKLAATSKGISAERKAKEKAWDNLYNEGGEGYNPYRS